MEDNCGFIFVKPHACIPSVIDLVRKKAQERGLCILREGELDNLGASVDKHYHAIASKAVTPVADLPVPPAVFEQCFGASWQTALSSGHVVTAAEAMKELNVDGDGMENIWSECKTRKQLAKLGGGFYCGKVRESPPLYCFNGFYMSMRQKYAAPGAQIYYFVVQWNSDELSWEKFRLEFLGLTDPRTASSSSLRGIILTNWKSLGLAQEPNVGDNAVHGSASPFEAWVEMQNWLKELPNSTRFGKALCEIVPRTVLDKWSLDPQVTYGHRDFLQRKSLFDRFEDKDSGEVLALAQAIASSDNVNQTSPPSAATLRSFYDRIAKLKEVKRTGWVREGVQNVETVACHSYGVALLALLLGSQTEDNLNVDKMIKMALLHDFAEHEVGDLVVDGSLEKRDKITREEKFRREFEVMRESMAVLSRPDLLELWEEFEQGETKEAQFMKDLDRLEMLYQAAHYTKTQKKDRPEDLDTFFQSTKGKFVSPICKEQDTILRNEREDFLRKHEEMRRKKVARTE